MRKLVGRAGGLVVPEPVASAEGGLVEDAARAPGRLQAAGLRSTRRHVNAQPGLQSPLLKVMMRKKNDSKVFLKYLVWKKKPFLGKDE